MLKKAKPIMLMACLFGLAGSIIFADGLERGRELYNKGNYNEAMQVLEFYARTIEDDASQIKSYAEANYLLAKIFYEAGDDLKVAGYLAKALKADRDIGRDEPVEAFKAKVDKLRALMPESAPESKPEPKPELKPEPKPGEVKIISVNGVDFEMVWIPPGEFLMGSPEGEKGRYKDEGPQHKVTISRGFWLGKYEVTQRQWQAITGGNPSAHKKFGLDAPVERVSWNNCQKFIQFLNVKTGSTFRLPTEAEWEYACRAGTAGERYGDIDAIAWYCDKWDDSPHPVGQKKANAWGLYDMLGNVCEWCQDRYGKYEDNSQLDPSGPSSGSKRVFRGGSFGHAARGVRSALRDGFDPSINIVDAFGFRMAMTSE